MNADEPGGPVETNLGLAVERARWWPFARRHVLVFGVNETDQNADLNNDGAQADVVLHTHNALTRAVANYHIATRNVSAGTGGSHFTRTGITFQSDENLRRFLRDLDDDGSFEERVIDGTTGRPRLDDNCPQIANPLQEDGDGIGDACDLCAADATNACCPAAPRAGCTALAEHGRTLLLLRDNDTDAKDEVRGCPSRPRCSRLRRTTACSYRC